MTRPNRRHLPTPSERFLLRAASLGDDDAVAAWTQWRRTNTLEACDRTSIDLLPAVYRNLREVVDLGPDKPLLHGTYRKAWVYNQLRLLGIAGALKAFDEQGIPTLVLKGAALTARYYRDAGVRPMADVDVLVPLAQAEAAYRFLLGGGWRPLFPPGGELRHVLEVMHSCGFERAGAGLDLHWHVLIDCCDPSDDDDFWSAADDLSLAGVDTRCLGPADMLLHVLVHGSKWTGARSVLWAMDAYRILTDDGPLLDWARLVRQAEARSVSLAVADGLRCLREVFDAPVPDGAIAALEEVATGLRERLDYRAQQTRDDFGGLVMRDVAGYLKLSSRRSMATQVRAAPWYLQAKFNVPSARELPADLARRLYRRALPAFKRQATPAG